MSLEPQNTQDDAATEPSTSRCESQEPIKGILKRPSLKYENKNKILPTITHRPSPDRFPDEPATRIPKLSVTWWEKNAVAIFGDTSDENNTDSEQLLKDLGGGGAGSQESEQRQTAILDSEEDSENVSQELQDLNDESRDDSISVTSSTGSASSSVVGRWWTGKDTRFVPHCQKRGCHHSHSDSAGYLTPTQRRNKEINDLKSELRTALKERDEKEKHLEELRERIKEVEVINVGQASLSDSHRLMVKEREAAEIFEQEKKQLERRHAVRVNQLVQETLTARDEILRLSTRVKELEKILNVPRVDSETMTEPIQFLPPHFQSSTEPIDPNQRRSVCSPSSAQLSPMPLSPVSSIPEMTFSTSLLTSPMCVESKVTGQQLYMSQEALNHIQACQNEAFIWRTKAAQLEIVVKDQLAKANRIEEALRAELLAARIGQPLNVSVSTKSTMTGDGDMNSDTSTHISTNPCECSAQSCVERIKNLAEENDRLVHKIEEANTNIHGLEQDILSLRNELEMAEDQRDKLKHQLENATRECDSKTAEIAACNIVSARHQSEKDTMQKAIAYMEERMQVYQNTLMEHDLVVSDENQAEWRKGFIDPRYNVMISKRVQTDLTADALSRHEDDFALTKQRLADLHTEFTLNRSDLNERFGEIEKILFTKTQVVDTLSKQLEETCRDQRQQIDAQQEERDSYKKKLEEISSVAEKVPLLETRIEQLLKEKSERDIHFSAQREEMEHALEEALSEALNKYKEQSEYWKSKQAALEQNLERAKAEIVQHIKEKDEMRIKSRLERADLERRLTSSIEHVAMLHSQVNKACRDVECEARPRIVSKYVACRPNTKSKSTTISKGDLFDENEERLKLCQGELATTRRQVHVLQQKLISSMQDKADKRLQLRRRIACVVDREPEPQKVDADKLKMLQEKNAKLCEQVTNELHLMTSKEEKAMLVRDERERIRHLVNEFENVRRELDQEMNRYESEKKWLKSRIRNLEADNEELQRTIQTGAKLRSGVFPDLTSIRKTVSEPELCSNDEELHQLREENIHLRRELDRVRDSLRRTAMVVSRDRSHMSPAFATLADDLNLVKSDLEQILSSMDHTTSATIGDDVAHTSSPIHCRNTVDDDEALQSDILRSVMTSWEADEEKRLVWDLKRSRQERDMMKVQIERLTHQLNEARAELEVYRREGVLARTTTSPTLEPRVVRCSSASNVADDVTTKDEVRVWKERCGTMFRELNWLRFGYQGAQEERRELRVQLAMLRGELEMARCQSEQDANKSDVSSVYFSPRSRSCQPSSAIHGSRILVYEKQTPFSNGSTHESVACHISASRPHVVHQKRRARSEQRRRLMSTRSGQNIKGHIQIESMDPLLLYSSTSSVADDNAVNRIPAENNLTSSQSWHESRNGNVLQRKYHAQIPTCRRESRTLLRERVGQLYRENRKLQEQLAAAKDNAGNATNSLANRFDTEQLNRSEQEKEALRMKNELLLVKCEQESSLAKAALDDLNEQLQLCRNENIMYEKKLRDMEEERKEMYLVMFKKGQEAAAMDLKEIAEVDQMTQDRVVLRFLHDAFYYYLMEKGNAKEHLQAIMTMLDFSVEQKDEIARKKFRSH